MIRLAGVTHEIQIGPESERVLSNISLDIPTDRRIAVLGTTPLARRALFDLLSGIVLPSKGYVTRRETVSFPVGFLGGFTPELTVRQNVEYVAKIYDQEVSQVVNFVVEQSGLGDAFDEPFGTLPRVDGRRLAPIVAYSIPFDVYLVTAGRKTMNHALSRESYELFKARALTSGMIVCTDPQFARLHCDMAMLIRFGKVKLLESVEEAIELLGTSDSEVVEDSFETPEAQAQQREVTDDWG